MQTEYPTTKYALRKATVFRPVTKTLCLLLLALGTLGFAQSPSNIFVTGATPANNTIGNTANNYSVVYASQTYNQTNQTYNQATTTNASAPDYCTTPANQGRPECQGVAATNNYYTNSNTYTNTTTTGLPSYCTNAANANRPECQSGYTQTTQPTQTTTTGQVPSYCQTAANQSRPECQGSSYQPTTNTTSYPSYCYQSQYSTRSECAGLYVTTPVTTAPVTQTAPSYCVYAEYQYRPECQTQVYPVTVLNPTTTQTITQTTTQLPAYCANPANQILAACQPTTTVTTPTSTTSTSNYPAYCSTPANQSRPECQGSVTTPTTTTVQPVPVNVPRPCIVGIYDPFCTPTTTTPVPVTVTVPTAPVAPLNCPTGTGGDNCVDSGDFALPVPPAPLSCQQNSVNNIQAIRDFCSAIYFTHAGAYANNSAVATIQRFQQFSFLLRSPYAGQAYIFSRSIDGSIQPLLPNPQIPQAVDVKLYSQVHIPNDVNTFGNNFSFTMNSPISEIFYVVLTQTAPANTFANIRTDQDLQNALLNLGLVNGIYHGIAGSPVLVN